MKTVRSLASLVLAVVVGGCCSYQVEVRVLDADAKPLSNVLVVATEQAMLSRNRQFIGRTDAKGQVRMVHLRGLAKIVAGCRSFYPAHEYCRGTTNLTLILAAGFSRHTERAAVAEHEEYKSGKTIYDRGESALWPDWNQYLVWLEDQDYFVTLTAD